MYLKIFNIEFRVCQILINIIFVMFLLLSWRLNEFPVLFWKVFLEFHFGKLSETNFFIEKPKSLLFVGYQSPFKSLETTTDILLSRHMLSSVCTYSTNLGFGTVAYGWTTFTLSIWNGEGETKNQHINQTTKGQT